jgi:small-conductance mechanosensitive channel
VDAATFWEEIKSALGLDEPLVAQTVAKGIQVLVVALVAIWIAHWVSDRIWRAARAGRTYAEVGALVSRAAGIAVYGIGAAIVLAILGVSWTAIAAILGAATFGISLALQDVGRSFVNGVYLLVERPFRIGDRVRIGTAEGRVEEVGVRLTALRTDEGDRIIVPNTVVFSSVIENASVGRGDLDRDTSAVAGIARAIPEIEAEVVAALHGIAYLAGATPKVAVLESTPEGTDIDVTIEHQLGHRAHDVVIDRLRAAFPEATITAKSAVSTT